MPGASKSTADAALQEDYQPLVRDQINNDCKILTYVEKNTRDIDGRRAVLSLHVARSGGIGARAEQGTLPTRGAQTFAEERVNLYYNYGMGSITGPLMRAADTNAAAFTKVLDFETKGLVNDLKRDVNRQLWGTSNGVIATTAANASATTILLSSAAPITSDVQFRQLEQNMYVDIGTVAAPTSKTSANQIISTGGLGTVGSPYSILLTTAAATAAGDFVFRSGNGGGPGATGAGQKEVTGLQSIVDSTGTLHNVNPTTYPVWASVEMDNAGALRAISENLMATVVQNINISSGTWPNLAVTHHGVFRAYANLLLGLKRFNDTVNLKGGYAQGLPFVGGGGNAIPVVVDRDAPANSMYFLNTDHLTEFMASDWEFMNDDGAVLSRLETTDEYAFTLFKYAELATDQRNTHGKLLDLSAS
jgi:hypothetical protein